MPRKKSVAPGLSVERITPSSLEPKAFAAVVPPVRTRLLQLPFDELHWDVFEYAALRLARAEGDVEYAARLGRPGQKQHGIDLFIAAPDGSYRSWQTKQWTKFTAKDVEDAVAVFRKGEWYARSTAFVLCVSCDLNDVKVQAEIENQRLMLLADGKKFTPLDRQLLSERCRAHPNLVDDLFGRDWVSAFLGEGVTAALSDRLRPEDASIVREFLLKDYDSRFRTLDASAHLVERTATAADLRSRVVRPDVSIQDTARAGYAEDMRHARAQMSQSDAERKLRNLESRDEASDFDEIDAGADLSTSSRADVDELLSSNSRTLIAGDAGSGKSTLLRCLALDLLSDAQVFPQTRERLAGSLPILIPFSFWVRQTELRSHAVSLEDIVRLFFAGAGSGANAVGERMVRVLGDARCVLLIDGLDEFTNASAARTTLQALESIAEFRQLRVIATGRPLGIRQLGGCSSWGRLEILPLTPAQQRAVAARWWKNFHSLAPETSTSADRWIARFFDQLERTGHLARIVGAPLILVGCLLVALEKGGALPGGRFGVFDALLDILVRVQPTRRELESSATIPRRVFADDALPLDCLSWLAFHMIESGAASGIDRGQARKIIAEFLRSEQFGWSPDKALQGAEDLVGISADTTGLLVERAPNEIGFLHASLRDHAAGGHLASRPFGDFLSFVDSNAAEQRWQNVILSGLHRIIRPTEMSKATTVISEAASRSKAATTLAAKVAGLFGHRAAEPSAKIIRHVRQIIEQGPNMAQRLDLLEALLDANGDGPAQRLLSDAMKSWIPSVSDHRADFYEATAQWPASAELKEMLIGVMEDDNISHRIAASESFAKLFGHLSVEDSGLLQLLQTADSSGGYAAKLNAFAKGWPNHGKLRPLLEEAASTPDGEMQAFGATALVALGDRSEHLRDLLIDLSSGFNAPYQLRAKVSEALRTGWQGDPVVEKKIWQRLNGGGSDALDSEVAQDLALGADSVDDRLAQWTVRRIREADYFLSGSLRENLEDLKKIADARPEVRDAINEWFGKQTGKAGSAYEAAQLAPLVKSEIALNYLLGLLEDVDDLLFWPVTGLLDAWGMSEPRVAAKLSPLLGLPPASRQHIAEYIPDISGDREAARANLLDILHLQDVERTDFVIRGLAKVSGPDDQEVISALLRHYPGKSRMGEGVADLFRVFGHNSLVRDFALSHLEGRTPTLGAIARYCGGDERIREKLLRDCRALPAALRNRIAKQAAEHPSSAPYSVLGQHFDREVHLDTRVRLTAACAEHALSSAEARKSLSAEFLSLLRVVGPDYPERRLTGFIGLVLLNDVERILEEFPDPTQFNAKLELISYRGLSDAALAVVADRWDAVTAKLGPDWKVRLKFDEDEPSIWKAMAPYAWRSDSLLGLLVQHCRNESTFASAPVLAALARAKPASTLLRSVCQRVLSWQSDRPSKLSTYDIECARLQALVILVDQFRDADPGTSLAFLDDGLSRHPQYADIFCGLSGGFDQRLNRRLGEVQGKAFAGWAHLMAIASAAPRGQFVNLLQYYLENRRGDFWDFASLCRRFIVGRLTREPGLATELLSILETSKSPDLCRGVAEAYALTWGIDDELRSTCSARVLHEESQYEALRFARGLSESSIRPLSASLKDLTTQD